MHQHIHPGCDGSVECDLHGVGILAGCRKKLLGGGVLWVVQERE